MLVKIIDKLLKKFFIDFTWFINYVNKKMESVEILKILKISLFFKFYILIECLNKILKKILIKLT